MRVLYKEVGSARVYLYECSTSTSMCTCALSSSMRRRHSACAPATPLEDLQHCTGNQDSTPVAGRSCTPRTADVRPNAEEALDARLSSPLLSCPQAQQSSPIISHPGRWRTRGTAAARGRALILPSLIVLLETLAPLAVRCSRELCRHEASRTPH